MATLYDDAGKPYNPSMNPEQQLVEKVLRIALQSSKIYFPFFKRQYLTHNFINDRQYTEQEERDFMYLSRIPLTLNIMDTYNKQVMGMMRSNRSGVIVSPVDQNTDPSTAELAQHIIDYMGFMNRIEMVENNVFNDGMCGMGVGHIYEDFTEDPVYGEVKIERVNPYNTFFDCESIDPLYRDMRHVTSLRYFTADELRAKWSKAVGKLNFDETEYECWWQEMQDMLPMWRGEQSTFVDQKNGLYAVIELEERKSKREIIIVDPNSGQTVGRFDREPAELGAFMQQTGMVVKWANTKYIEKTHVMPYNLTFLEQVKEPYSNFSYIPFLSVRNGQKLPDCTSYNYRMVGLQRKINMRHTNIEEIVIRSIRGGFWVYTEGGGQALIEEMNANGSKIGRNYLVKGVPGNEPRPIMPNNIIGGLQYLEENELGLFQQVTGLSAQPFGGKTQPSESGVHRAQVREETQTTLYPTIDDFNDYRAIIAETMLERKIAQLELPWAIRLEGKEGSEFVQVTEQDIQKLKGSRKFDIRIAQSPFMLQRKMDEQEERLMLTDYTSKTFGPGLTMPGDIWRGSRLPDGKEQGDAIDQRYLEAQELQTQMMLGGGGQPHPAQQ